MNYGYQHASHVIDWYWWLAIIGLRPGLVYSRKDTCADLDAEEEREGLYR